MRVTYKELIRRYSYVATFIVRSKNRHSRLLIIVSHRTKDKYHASCRYATGPTQKE